MAVITYALPALAPGTTYYWRIVSKTMAPREAAGAVYSFTTAGAAEEPLVRLAEPEALHQRIACDRRVGAGPDDGDDLIDHVQRAAEALGLGAGGRKCLPSRAGTGWRIAGRAWLCAGHLLRVHHRIDAAGDRNVMLL